MSISPVTPSVYDAFSSARNGLSRSEKRLNGAAREIASGDISSSRMVELIVSERMYQANASVIRTSDQMLGALINVKR